MSTIHNIHYSYPKSYREVNVMFCVYGRILLLDEATSALDSASEACVQVHCTHSPSSHPGDFMCTVCTLANCRGDRLSKLFKSFFSVSDPGPFVRISLFSGSGSAKKSGSDTENPDPLRKIRIRIHKQMSKNCMYN